MRPDGTIGWVLVTGRCKSDTYEENEAGIVVPVTIILFIKEGRKYRSIFGFSLQFGGIDTTYCAPTDLVPVRDDIGTGVY